MAVPPGAPPPASVVTLPHAGRAKAEGDTERERDRVALAELDAVPPLLAERDCDGERELNRVDALADACGECDCKLLHDAD